MNDIKEVAVLIAIVAIMSYAVNIALSRYDPPVVGWQAHIIPKDTYLWNLSATYSSKLEKDTQTIVDLIKKKNKLNDNFLSEGSKILVPKI